MNGEVVVFWISAIFAVVGALGLVVSRKAVHSALWVAFTMINLAILYFSLEAPFLGTTQIVVYTGAVMMLFLLLHSWCQAFQNQSSTDIVLRLGLQLM